MPCLARRAVLAAALAVPAVARAQGVFPDRPLRLVVPFPPGGTADLLARLAAREMEAGLGQPVVVENRAGAGGAIGSEAVARAAPDGHTLLLSNIASQAIGPAVNRGAPYDPDASFTHIGLIAAVPSAVAVAAASPFRTMADLSGRGAGAARHGALRLQRQWHLFPRQAGAVEPAGGGGDHPCALSRLGPCHGGCAGWGDRGADRRRARHRPQRAAAPADDHRRTPRRPLAGGARGAGGRLPQLVAANWFGLSGPAGVPPAVAQRINAALIAGLNREETANRLRDLGAEPNRLTPAEYTALVRADIARWGQLVREADIRAD